MVDGGREVLTNIQTNMETIFLEVLYIFDFMEKVKTICLFEKGIKKISFLEVCKRIAIFIKTLNVGPFKICLS